MSQRTPCAAGRTVSFTSSNQNQGAYSRAPRELDQRVDEIHPRIAFSDLARTDQVGLLDLKVLSREPLQVTPRKQTFRLPPLDPKASDLQVHLPPQICCFRGCSGICCSTGSAPTAPIRTRRTSRPSAIADSRAAGTWTTAGPRARGTAEPDDAAFVGPAPQDRGQRLPSAGRVPGRVQSPTPRCRHATKPDELLAAHRRSDRYICVVLDHDVTVRPTMRVEPLVGVEIDIRRWEALLEAAWRERLWIRPTLLVLRRRCTCNAWPVRVDRGCTPAGRLAPHPGDRPPPTIMRGGVRPTPNPRGFCARACLSDRSVGNSI
jgi:hypothetical protein